MFKKSLVIIACSAVLLVAPLATVQAQILPNCTGVANANAPACTVDDIFKLLVNVYNWLMGLAAVVAMLFIVWAGLRMMYHSFVENSEGELANAKSTLTHAISGLVIIIIAYLVVNTIVILLTGGNLSDLFAKFGINNVF